MHVIHLEKYLVHNKCDLIFSEGIGAAPQKPLLFISMALSFLPEKESVGVAEVLKSSLSRWL